MKESFLSNFKSAFYHLIINKIANKTDICANIGYTSTRQLNNILDGKTMPSGNSIVYFIETYKINPNYLFFGKLPIIIGEKNEMEKKETNKIKSILITFE